MYNDNCIYCKERQLIYDIEGATKLNAMQAEVIAHLTEKVARLRAGLESLRQEHDPFPEDPWYGCPKLQEQYDEPGEPERCCNCGAEEYNARIDALLETTA